jgi:hypothetical protein
MPNLMSATQPASLSSVFLTGATREFEAIEDTEHLILCNVSENVNLKDNCLQALSIFFIESFI